MSETNYEKCHVSYRGRMEREIDAARELLQKHKKPCAAAVRELRDETDLSLHESCSMIRCLWRDDKLEKLQAENARLKRDLEDQGAYDQYLRDRLNQENDLRMAAEAEKAKLRDELAKWESLTANIELPEQPITEFEPKDLERENAELRKLARDVGKAARMFCQAWEGSCSKDAEGMSLHAPCPIGDTSKLCVFGDLSDRMRELGIKEGT